MFDALPQAALLIGDRGYDSDGFRAALAAQGTTPCIPPRRNRKVQHEYDVGLYKTRHKVENMFAKLKDWRRVVTRYDRCADIFMGTITLAAIVILIGSQHIRYGGYGGIAYYHIADSYIALFTSFIP